jgi:glycosyltransferase involved in cell wall biosynthesis
MQRVVLPTLRRRSLETLSHTALSVIHRSIASVDAAILFNAANAPLLPVLRARRVPVATHVDGLEWKRAKWGPMGQRYYRWAESLSVRWSDALIADAEGIADYYRAEFAAPSSQIAYGAPILVDPQVQRLSELGLSRGRYHLVVARFEPENHVLEIVRGYVRSRAELPLVVVGSAPYADEYTTAIEAAADRRVRLLGGVWDQDLLDALYAGSLTYLHGHSVGGTNPSLLRAGGAGAAVIAYDVGFNREVLGEPGVYFGTEEELAQSVERAESAPADTRQRGEEVQKAIARYDWDAVASEYEALLTRLAEAGPTHRRQRPTGRRNSPSI